MKQVYTLQFVGLDPDGVQPRDPMAPKANRCVTSIGEDTAGAGIGLSFASCPHFVSTDKFGIPSGEPQPPEKKMMFQFMDNGRIRHFQTGKCIRRVPCGKTEPGSPVPYLYDLGHCDETSAVRWEFWEARANRADIAMPLGNPLNGLLTSCKMCGPFLMQQVCRGPCDDVQPVRGWTKDNSQYIRPKIYSDTTRYYLQMAPYQLGLCGSFFHDDEEVSSWWYFHKYAPP